MHPETEVHFCNICNTSIPEAAIRDGKAVRVDGKVIPTAAGGAPVEAVRGAKGAVFGAAVLICAALAGATVFIDWRLSERGRDAKENSGRFRSAAWRHRDSAALPFSEDHPGQVLHPRRDAVSNGLESIELSVRGDGPWFA